MPQCPLYECRSVGVDFVPAASQEPLLVEQTSQESPEICPNGSSSATSNNTLVGLPRGDPNAGCTILTQADVASSSFADSTQHTNAYSWGST